MMHERCKKDVCGMHVERAEFWGISLNSGAKVRRIFGICKDGEIIAVLDIDSANYNTFDLIDQKYLEQIAL